MRNNSNTACLGLVVGLIFAGIFACLFATIAGAMSVEAVVLNPNVYKRAAATQNLYERLPGELAAIPVNNTSTSEEQNVLRFMDSEDYAIVWHELLPPELTRSIMEELIDQTTAYYSTTDPNARIQISMVELKSLLAGEGGDQIMRQIVSSWPPCTEEEMQQWTVAMETESWESVSKCAPPKEVLDQFTPVLGEIFNGFAASIPDTADLTPKYVTPGEDPRQEIQIARWCTWLSPLLLLGLLIIITLIGVRSPQSLFQWWGGTFLASGILSFGVAIILGLMVESIFASMIQEITSQGAENDIFTLAMEMIRHVMREAGIRAGIVSILIGGAGGAMLVIRALLWRNPQQIYEIMPR